MNHESLEQNRTNEGTENKCVKLHTLVQTCIYK